MNVSANDVLSSVVRLFSVARTHFRPFVRSFVRPFNRSFVPSFLRSFVPSLSLKRSSSSSLSFLRCRSFVVVPSLSFLRCR